MNAENLYDDEKAIAFIRESIDPALSEKLSDDAMYYFLDLIDEYYQETVLDNFSEDEDSDEDIFIDEEDMCRFFRKNLAKEDFGTFTDDEMMSVVDAEMQYTESIG